MLLGCERDDKYKKYKNSLEKQIYRIIRLKIIIRKNFNYIH